MFNSSNQALYEPAYISLLLIFLGIVYLIYLVVTIIKIKLDILTISTLFISFLTYFLVGFYMAGTGYYIDNETPKNLVFESIGFPELILLAFPYIFLSLAASLGDKKYKINSLQKESKPYNWLLSFLILIGLFHYCTLIE